MSLEDVAKEIKEALLAKGLPTSLLVSMQYIKQVDELEALLAPSHITCTVMCNGIISVRNGYYFTVRFTHKD